MTTPRPTRRVAILLMAWLIAGASTASAQEALARAKDFYASAAYEEALQVLESLHSADPSASVNEVAAYQVFCLVALGRSAEAKHAIEAIVRTDPLYHPPEAQASPRVRAYFEDVRRPLLPEVVKQSYAKGKDAYDKKEMPTAAAEFDRVIALLDEMGASADPSVADLHTLAAGFRDLSKAAAAPAPPAAAPDPAPAAGGPAANIAARTGDAAASVPGSTPTATVAPVPIYGAADEDVKPPIAISQVMPRWTPANPIEEKRDFRGSLELVIGEDGKVKAAVLTKSVKADYDAMLLKAAQGWTFRPATRNGVSVKYRVAVDIHLGR
jgi:tetratricopeptide (TPR) repeat protein